MPNLPSLYTQLTTAHAVSAPPVEPQPEEDAGHQQLRVNWLQSTITQELMDKQGEECSKLLQEAIDLAVTHRNPERIIQNLIRVDTLRKVMTYGQRT